MADDDEEDGGNLLKIFIIVFVALIALVILYFLIAYFAGWPPFTDSMSDDSGVDVPVQCSDRDVLSVEEAYGKYVEGSITDNPLILFSSASNTTHYLRLRKIPQIAGTCFTDGYKSVPFPQYCQAFTNYNLVNEYVQEPNQTSTTTRTYVDEDDNVLTFKQNCVPVAEDAYFYSPATKW